MVLGRQVGVTTTRRHMGSLHQGSGQGLVAMARRARVALPSAFVIARSGTRLSCQVVSRWEAAHVVSDLRNNHFGGAPRRESCPTAPPLL